MCHKLLCLIDSTSAQQTTELDDKGTQPLQFSLCSSPEAENLSSLPLWNQRLIQGLNSHSPKHCTW